VISSIHRLLFVGLD